MIKQQLEQKYQALLDILKQQGAKGLLVCFSGGVDSSLVLAAAKAAGISPLLAVTFVTPTTTAADKEAAATVAKELAVEQVVLEFDTLAIPQLAQNSLDRCYHCKLALFGQAQLIAQERGIKAVVDGNNADDMQSFRPGNKAAAQLGICHPLAEAALTKEQIREKAKSIGLSNHSRPSSPCLASRFPYDTALTADKLAAAAQGEQVLHGIGLEECRLRIHGELCRIEIPPSKLQLCLDNKDSLTKALHELGFGYITLDLDGIKSGSFDREN